MIDKKELRRLNSLIQIAIKKEYSKEKRFKLIKDIILDQKKYYPNYNIEFQPLKWIKKGYVGKLVSLKTKPIIRIIVGTAPILYATQINLDAWAVVEITKK